MKLGFVYLLFTALLIGLLRDPTPEAPYDPLHVNRSHQPSLKHGAQLYRSYCAGCHSLRYMDRERLLNDVTIDADLQHVAMSRRDAMQWFGIVPPDLSLIAKQRTPAWIYTYLTTFFVDPKRPFGVNNQLKPNVAMPNILEPLLGEQKLHFDKEASGRFSLIKRGVLDSKQADHAVLDIVTFLTYVADPTKLMRYRIGVVVLIFLFIFLLVVYPLKKLYWKK